MQMTSRTITRMKIGIMQIRIVPQRHTFGIKDKHLVVDMLVSAEIVMACYTSTQYAEMIVIYGECQRNARAAARVYAERFPMDRHPTHRTITAALHRLRETGTVEPRPRSSRRTRRNVRVTPEEVLGYALVNPQLSTAEISEACGYTRQHVWHLLHAHGAHPYHPVLVQALIVSDHARRFDFCNFMLNTLQEKPSFFCDILWTDESTFTRSGIVNKHNVHYWDLEKPHIARTVRHQVRWSTNVWCGIWGTQIVGPIFYDGTLTGDRYLHQLQNMVRDWYDELPLRHACRVWFQHDGAPPHKASNVRAYLATEFGQQIIGYGGPVEWPPRSPDLTPMDFYLWGYIKAQVYVTEPTSLIDLKQRIILACRTVTPAMLQRVQGSVLSRIQLCIATNGEHFEQYL